MLATKRPLAARVTRDLHQKRFIILLRSFARQPQYERAASTAGETFPVRGCSVNELRTAVIVLHSKYGTIHRLTPCADPVCSAIGHLSRPCRPKRGLHHFVSHPAKEEGIGLGEV